MKTFTVLDSSGGPFATVSLSDDQLKVGASITVKGKVYRVLSFTGTEVTVDKQGAGPVRESGN